MVIERIEFPGHTGDMLAARLDRPARTPVAFALFAHCFTCSKDIAGARRISQRLAGLGLAVLRFDFTGLGHSQGEFANTTFSSNVEDLVQAAAWMRDSLAAPRLLIGHSLGGAAVLAAAGAIPEARAVATIGAPHDPAHVIRSLGASVDEIREHGEAQVSLAGRPFTIRRAFLDDIAGQKLDVAIRNLGKALLVLHAPRDDTVAIDEAGRIFMAARHPKSFVTLDDADHLLNRPEDANYAAEVIASWSRRYLDLPAAETEGAPVGVVRATEADAAGFLQDIAAGPRHALVADEPRSVGGTDLGPSPYDLLSAGLAACTSMTVRMYARRKGWPLDGISVDVTHDKIHAADCADCETQGGKVDVFRRVVRLVGGLTDEQRARLMEIADKCPVHRTLESEIRVKTVAG